MKEKLSDFEKEVQILRGVFLNSYEQAGGQGHRFFHSVRAAQTCLRLYPKLIEQGTNRALLGAAALFHDIGKAPRVEKEGYLDGSQAADLAKGKHDSFEAVFPLLQNFLGTMYSEEELRTMASFISGKDSLESQLLQDADQLDEVGLVNVWKMFTYGGINKVSIEDSINYYFKEDRPRLLKKIEERFHFPLTKQIAFARVEKVDQFLNNLVKEGNAEDL